MEYILDARTYLPKFMKESNLMLSIVDCLNILISSEQPVFDEIKGAYQDMIYRCRDYSKLTYDAKINIIKELGFDYLLDILTLTSEQLTQLLIFFNLIYVLKGKKEGLAICLDTLGMKYTYTTWDEMSPRGQRFTAKLAITGNDYAETKVFKKIRTFVRSYMLPWVDITVELTIDGPPLYIYPSGYLFMGYRDKQVFTATRDVFDLALYDYKESYDRDMYGADIFDGPDQDNPYSFEDVTLTISCNKSAAKIIIDGEETSSKKVERCTPINYSVQYENQKVERIIVCNQDRNIEVNF